MALPPRPRAATLGQQAGRNRELPPGSVVLGRYTVQKVLGRGGMATVYLAKHQQTDRLVGLKLLDPEISKDPAYVERFRREAKAAGRIRSDYVVAIYDLDAEVGGSLVLVMEYLEGQSVQQALKGGRMPIQRALSFGRQMLEGLAAAHEAGVIHRDLKPANLFIEKSTTGSEKLKLLDFGISKLADASQQELTRDGQTLGTVAYMAPEQIRGKAVASDGRVDLYSAGVSLFIMLSGKRPIDAEDTVQLLAAVLENPPLTLANATGLPFPAPIEKFIAKALEKDPARRFQTALEMRDALVEAGKAVGYEQTGPLSLPTNGAQPSGVVRSPAKPAGAPGPNPMGGSGPMAGPGPGPAQGQGPGPGQQAYIPKQTMMGVGGPAPSVTPTMPPAEVGGMNAPVPMGMAGYANGMPQQNPPPPLVQGGYDPFGPPPNHMAPPPSAGFGPPAYAQPVAPAVPAAKKSNAPMLIILSAVGLVALGGAGAIMMKSMNASQTMTRRVVGSNTASVGAASSNNNNNGNNGNNNNNNNNGNGTENSNPNAANQAVQNAGPNPSNGGSLGTAQNPPSQQAGNPTVENGAATGGTAAQNTAPVNNPGAIVVVHNGAPANVEPPVQANNPPANQPSAQAATQPTARNTNTAPAVNVNARSNPPTVRTNSAGSSAATPPVAATARTTTSRSNTPTNSAIADIFGTPTPRATTTTTPTTRTNTAATTTATARTTTPAATTTNTTHSTGRRNPRPGPTSVVPF